MTQEETLHGEQDWVQLLGLDRLPEHIIGKRVTELMDLSGKKAFVTGAGGDGYQINRPGHCPGRNLQRQPFIGHSSLLVARSAGQTETYSLPLSWIRKVDARIF